MTNSGSPLWPRAVLFDCAQTLLDVRWDEADLIRRVAESIQLPLQDGDARRYRQMHRDRRTAYVLAHQTAGGVDAFWDNLLRDWREEVGIPEAWHASLTEACEALIFGADSPFFQPFADALPTLTALRDAKIRLAIVSNWDSSLERLLSVHGLRDFFEVVAASLVVGVEKPDPRIFDWTLARLGVEPKDCLHIGDSEEDDAVGAQNAGIPNRLIDRANPIPHGISNLGEILELIQWTA